MRKTRLIFFCVFSIFLLDLAITLPAASDRMAWAGMSEQTQNEKTVKGIIRDANGEPVIGASVI